MNGVGRRRFLTDVLFVAGGALAAALLMAGYHNDRPVSQATPELILETPHCPATPAPVEPGHVVLPRGHAGRPHPGEMQASTPRPPKTVPATPKYEVGGLVAPPEAKRD